LKKKLQKFFKKGEKRKKRRKIEKNDAKKRALLCGGFNPFKDVKIGKVEKAALGAIEWLSCLMLKWVR